MSDIQLTLSATERDLIVRLVDRELGETRSEFHRTHYSPEFRDDVEREEKLLRQLLDKLRVPVM